MTACRVACMELRDYQLECIQTMHSHFQDNDRQIVQMPTGAGKTITFLKYLSLYSKRSLILVPTRELLEQVDESALHFFHKSEVFAKYDSNIVFKKVNIMTAASVSYESITEKLLEAKFDTIIIDEAHRAQSDTYKNFIGSYKQRHPKVKICGFTATPERSDKLPLLEIFDKLTFSRTIYDLINLGHLCDMVSYRIKTGQKFETRRLSAGDFSPICLKILDNDTRNNIILKTYKDNCVNKKTLVFCLSINHALKLEHYFAEHGIAARAIYGAMPKGHRKQIIKDFKSGKIMVLFNCQLLTEGFDEPSIDAIMITRPTKSKSLYCQMIGRGLRNSPGKKFCYLYELTENVHNISTFNVACELDDLPTFEYEDGIRLTQLKETFEGMSLKDFSLIKEKIIIFDKKAECLFSNTATQHQIELLKKLNIPYMNPISIYEAGYLLWKHRLKAKYEQN